MQALILATNETEKLFPISNSVPTALLPIVNKPIMEYIVEDLSNHGIVDIIVILLNLGGSIESYFGTGQRWGVNLNYVLLNEPEGNLGAISWARSVIDDDLIFIPGDILINFDLKAAIAAHTQSKADLTLIEYDHVDQEDDSPQHTGIFVLNEQLQNVVHANRFKDLDSDLLPYLQQQNAPVHRFSADSFCDPLTSFNSYNETQNRLLNENIEVNLDAAEQTKHLTHSKIKGSFLGNGVWVGKHNMIDPSVRFSPPVVIGDNCQIGRGVELGPNVVIGSNVIIDGEATIKNSTVLDFTYIGHLVNVDSRFAWQNLIIDNQSGTHVQISDPFIASEAAPRVLNLSLRRVIDTSIAICLTLLFFPILIGISLLTLVTTGKIISKDEVFGVTYRQLNKGTKGTPEYFKLFRFHTRRKGEITRFGRLLRALDLHRLPELFNIILGDLCLVGVQPIRPSKMGQLTEDWQFQKFNYSCGFTGLWYVQDPLIVNSDSTIVFDIYYVAMRNFKDDMRIFFKTPVTWWSKITQNS